MVDLMASLSTPTVTPVAKKLLNLARICEKMIYLAWSVPSGSLILSTFLQPMFDCSRILTILLNVC